MFEDEIITPEGEDDVLMPEGYAEGDDIFADSKEWTGEVKVDAPETDPEQTEDEPEVDEEEAPTTELETESGDTGEPEEAPTTEQPQTLPNKLKFRARVDRNDVDVEVDESELPSLYQKAQVVDRVQAKLAKQTPLLEQAERLSKVLGFDTFESMLANAEKNYRDTELQRLTESGTPKEIAEDYIERKIAAQPKAAAEPEAAPAEETPTRDFNAEARDLVKARPDLAGQRVPDEVVKACIAENKSLLVAYTEYEAKQQKAEAERLRRENKILKQNEASAKQAPVKGVRGGGAADTKPEDDFLRGFNSDY